MTSETEPIETVPKTIKMPKTMIALIEEFGKGKNHVTFSESIRHLVELGLESSSSNRNIISKNTVKRRDYGKNTRSEVTLERKDRERYRRQPGKAHHNA